MGLIIYKYIYTNKINTHIDLYIYAVIWREAEVYLKVVDDTAMINVLIVTVIPVVPAHFIVLYLNLIGRC